MNRTEIVYQAIKDLSSQYSGENDITEKSLASYCKLAEDEIILAIRELHKLNKIKIDDFIPSTGRDDFGEILEFVGIEVV